MSASDISIAPNRDLRPARVRFLGFAFDLRAVRAVLIAYLSTRLLLFLIILFSSTTIPMRVGNFPYASPDNLLIDGLVRDDSWWYTNIAMRGYDMGDIKTGAQGNVAFFPLYPLAIKMAAAVTGNVFIAGVLVSNLAFVVALGYLYGLTRREFDEDTADRAVFYLAAAPTAVFFSALYTESLYIALVCATFYYARRGQWDRAALAGALTAATRNTGVLMTAVVALECLSQQGVRFRPARWWAGSLAATLRLWRDHIVQQIRPVIAGWRGLLAASFVPLGLIGYMAFLANRFGDPLGFIHVQATWGRSTSAVGLTKLVGNVIKNLELGSNIWLGQINTQTALNLLATLAFAPLIVAVALKMRPAHAAFVGLTFFIPISTGTVGSMTRYILMLIPCFMLLAHWGRRGWVDRLVLGIFLPLMGYFAILFSHWYFAG
jgi:hypothetical protein